MFSLTSIDNKLVLTQKRCGLVVEKSFIAGIHINDEVIEINHIKVELLNNADVKRYLHCLFYQAKNYIAYFAK